MSAKYDYDILIVGGGLSGLTMALSMQRYSSLASKKICIIEKRQEYLHDKTWCGWAVRPHDFQNCVQQSWDAWSVLRAGNQVTQQSAKMPYQYIPSKAFYDECLRRIEKENNIELKMDVTVETVSAHQVDTSLGSLTADTIFDARPARLTDMPFKNYLLQCFHGWHIETESATFNPNTVTLMDFPDNQKNGIHFLYVLPLSETQALIEPTYFLHHQNIPDKKHFHDLMTRYLAEQYDCTSWRVLAHETGVLPMMRVPNQPTHRSIIPIGSHAGLLRPATGYAFFGIMRYCDWICQAYETHGEFRSKPAYSKSSSWMDDVFLKVCRSAPERAADIFFSLFQHSSAETIARFMQDEAKASDLLRVISSVPSAPFIRAAFSPTA